MVCGGGGVGWGEGRVGWGGGRVGWGGVEGRKKLVRVRACDASKPLGFAPIRVALRINCEQCFCNMA